jgi:sugar phosphate isomerase/epimerase
VFVSASTRCFADRSFDDACQQFVELEFDKLEIWLDEESRHLRPSDVASNPDQFYARYRETTRLTPIGICVQHDVPSATLAGLAKAAKLLRVTQITLPASPLGTPFNTEVDRLREFVRVASENGIRLSIKTESGHLTEDPHTAVELCQAVRGLGITLDPSYYMLGPNNAGRSYDQVFPYVYHTHLRDSTSQSLQVQVGLGELDYTRLINQLKRRSYNRALSIEILPSPENAAERPLELRKLRMLLDTLL